MQIQRTQLLTFLLVSVAWAHPITDFNQGQRSELGRSDLSVSDVPIGAIIKREVTEIKPGGASLPKPTGASSTPPAVNPIGKPSEANGVKAGVKPQDKQAKSPVEEVDDFKTWLAKHRENADEFKTNLRKKVDSKIDKYQQGLKQKNGGTGESTPGTPEGDSKSKPEAKPENSAGGKPTAEAKPENPAGGKPTPEARPENPAGGKPTPEAKPGNPTGGESKPEATLDKKAEPEGTSGAATGDKAAEDHKP